MSELVTPSYVDRRLFSLHEAEDVVEITPHRRQVSYLETNLQTLFPDRFVGANLGVYWVRGQFRHPWTGPDVLVAAPSPRGDAPRVWVVWEDGPLQFVGEVASDETRAQEPKKRVEIYQNALAVPEYLFVDLDRHQLELWRLEDGVYLQVPAERGCLYSQQLGVWFGWQPDRALVRMWTADGRMLRTPEERQQQTDAAEQRAAAEARLRQEEQRLRQEAEARGGRGTGPPRGRRARGGVGGGVGATAPQRGLKPRPRPHDLHRQLSGRPMWTNESRKIYTAARWSSILTTTRSSR
jgi:Uma2 family endonuclease